MGDSERNVNLPKKTPNDFVFVKVIGEGSFSNVFLGREVATQKEFAIKVCEKKLIVRERKTAHIVREKEIVSRLAHPFFVRLYCTFQDAERLYFVLTLARRGDLLTYLTRLSSLDEACTRFYTAELVLALEYLADLGIVHRDLKPENILLGDDWHILVTDFGSAKVLNEEERLQPDKGTRSSFVGTAQYVSPEVLSSKSTSYASDLWALGCIIYQMLSGRVPFRAANEYLIFQAILRCEYQFPEGFVPSAADLVRSLLKLTPSERIGMPASGGYDALKQHAFFEGIDWAALPSSHAPELCPNLPPLSGSLPVAPSPFADSMPPASASGSDANAAVEMQTGLTDEQLSRLLAIRLCDDEDVRGFVSGPSTAGSGPAPAPGTPLSALLGIDSSQTSPLSAAELPAPQRASLNSRNSASSVSAAPVSPAPQKDNVQEMRKLLDAQQRENVYHRFVRGRLILHQGQLDKRKGLFAKRRIFLLTQGPHLFYVDPVAMVAKGEVPWSASLRAEARNFKIFYVHTPNRTYYLEDPSGHALGWVHKIQEVHRYYFGSTSQASAAASASGGDPRSQRRSQTGSPSPPPPPVASSSNSSSTNATDAASSSNTPTVAKRT